MLASLVLLAWVVVLAGQGSAAVPSDYELHVRPRICVLLGGETSCAMQLAVSWSAPAVTDVCLKLAHADSVLQCWQQQRVGTLEIELQRGSNTIVQLLDASSNLVLSEAEVTIVSRDLRDSRRRRRHVWSII